MDSNHRIAQLSVTATIPRQTPANEFGAVMARAVSQVARMGTGLMGAIAGGTPVVSAAVSGLASTAAASVQRVDGLFTTAGTAGTTGRGEQWDLLEAQKLLSSQSQSFNLAYMQLQDEMQKESRQFNTVSNIMKVRHDSAKAAINNIR